MDPQEYRRLRDLFDELEPLPADLRRQRLDNEFPPSDPNRLELESWLKTADTLPLPSTPNGHPVADGAVIASRYRVASPLGEGGFAHTYLAHDEDLHNRKVVLKIPKRPSGVDPAWFERHFVDEVRALASLNHPGIVSVLDSGADPAAGPFVVLHFIEGTPLRDLLRNGPLSPSRAASILVAAARALQAAHSQGIVHRDIKPENILLRAPGSAEEAPVLIDFGISSLDSGARTTQIVGSPNYIAPEQALGHPTPRSDIYALGCIAIEMLTGRALHEHLQGRQPSVVAAEMLAAHVPFLAPNLRAALASLVSLSQQARPADAAALVPIFERLSSSKRTSRLWLVAWSAVVLVLTGYFALPRFFVTTQAPAHFHVQATKALSSGAPEAVSLLGGTVRAGDRLRFAARSASPVRLHVFAAGASGVSLLFPAASSALSSTFRIPATENDAIEFDNTEETVRLWFCLSPDPWPELERIAAAARQSGDVPRHMVPALEDIVRRTGLPALAFDSATQSFRAAANLPICAQGSLNHERRP